MDGAEKIRKIETLLFEGYTVEFANHLHRYPITQTTKEKLERAGYSLFEPDGNSVLMRYGNQLICMDGCKITYY